MFKNIKYISLFFPNIKNEALKDYYILRG